MVNLSAPKYSQPNDNPSFMKCIKFFYVVLRCNYSPNSRNKKTMV